jgi:hypothetical protein
VFLLCSISIPHDRPTRELAHAHPEADGKAGCRSKPKIVVAGGSAGGATPTGILAIVLQDPRALSGGLQTRQMWLSEIQRHVLRVSCRRCLRIVEIQKADTVRLYGPQAVWKDVGQRLLDGTCQVRIGRHEEDGCWPSFE